jgi:hypothetical protein
MRNDDSMRREADLPFVDVLDADFDRDAVGTLWAGAGVSAGRAAAWRYWTTRRSRH